MQACESYRDAEEVAAIAPGVKGRTLLGLETTVLEGLHFDLVVYEPYTCIDCMVEVRLSALAAARFGRDNMSMAPSARIPGTMSYCGEHNGRNMPRYLAKVVQQEAAWQLDSA